MEQNSTDILPAISIGIVVQDLAASQRFYTELIGMKKVTDFPVTAAESKQMGFSGGMPFHIYLYETVEKSNTNHITPTNLKLIDFNIAPSVAETTQPYQTPPRPEQTAIESYAGVNYLSFNYPSTDALADATATLINGGVHILGDISNQAFSASYFRDPNGVFIELLYVPPHK